MSIIFPNLPEPILTQIIDYLPAQDKLNLLYTSYQFYLLVQPLLYKNLYFSKSYQLSCPNSFDEARYTMVGFVKTPLATKELNHEIYQARQEILLEAMTVNPELAKFVENVVIEGNPFNYDRIEPLEEIINSQLLDFFKLNCCNLKRIFSLNSTVPNIVLPSLKYLQLSSFKPLKQVSGNNVKSLQLAITDDLLENPETIDNFLDFVKRLDELKFDDERSQLLFMKFLAKSLGGGQITLRLKSLKIIFYHQYENPKEKLLFFLNSLDFECLKKLEMEIGCDDMTCDCLHEFTDLLIQKGLNVSQLSLIQKTTRRDHNYTEAFDFLVTSFLRKNPRTPNIKILNITHMPPDDFNVGFGFEGNYLHRKDLYEAALPSLKGLETFSSPTFLQSIACYEQMISNLLWNGCQCSHCEDYLPIYDKYIMQHQYYDEMKSHMTDMISPILFGNVGKVLGSRKHCSGEEFPTLNRFWNFHDAPYEISHFSKGCPYDGSAFLPATICVIHFLQEYVDNIGMMIPTLKRCILSGVTFYKDSISKTWSSSEDYK